MKKVVIIGICEKFDEPKHNPEYYKKLSDRVLELIDNSGSTSLWKLVLNSKLVCLFTDEPCNLEEIKLDNEEFIVLDNINFEKLKSYKCYLIEKLDKDAKENSWHINKLRRKYENKPNLWERIFGF